MYIIDHLSSTTDYRAGFLEIILAVCDQRGRRDAVVVAIVYDFDFHKGPTFQRQNTKSKSEQNKLM